MEKVEGCRGCGSLILCIVSILSGIADRGNSIVLFENSYKMFGRIKTGFFRYFINTHCIGFFLEQAGCLFHTYP